jgi:hypothetical protein
MLLKVADLGNLPGNWCCDQPADDPVGAFSECPPSRKFGTFFQSDEPVAGTPDPRYFEQPGRNFSEVLLQFPTSQDAIACMSALRGEPITPSSERRVLSFPTLRDETVALTARAGDKDVHLVEVRRSNVILHIGADADDRTLSYVQTALTKLDRVLAQTPAAAPPPTAQSPSQ